jgi:DNA-binding helix-hairpin-helix protein with protein kinase domain
VAAQQSLAKYGEPVGDIRPHNVFISNDQKVKIGSLASFPYEQTNFSKLNEIINPSFKTLLAP